MPEPCGNDDYVACHQLEVHMALTNEIDRDDLPKTRRIMRSYSPSSLLSLRSGLALPVTGVLCILLGLVLLGGGAWLTALGDSPFYALLGVGIAITGGLLLARMRSALWAFALVLL